MNRHTPLFLLLSSLFGSLAVSPSHADTPKPTAQPKIIRLTFAPASAILTSPYSEVRLLVAGQNANGTTQDVSDKSTFTLDNPKLATIDETGTVRPRSNGKTVIKAQFGTLTTQISLTISGISKSAAPRFLSDVIPVLTRTGCNMGACHGAAQGKGNFRLSLLGYDPESDYLSITKAINGRRVSVAQPDTSLLLLKPLMAVIHKGGRRFEKNSPDYCVLHDWIAAGMPQPDPNEAAITQLEILPKIQTLVIGGTQRYRVVARFSDGTQRDVSNQALFDSTDASVATVTPSGNATVTGKGGGAVVIRYQGLVATARIISPFRTIGNREQGTGNRTLPTEFGVRRGNGLPRLVQTNRAGQTPYPTRPVRRNAVPALPNDPTTQRPDDRIDSLVNAKLRELGLDASPYCSDADFLRRASLDVVGLLPTPDETRAFLADKSPDKRAKLVDALLERPEYVDYWTLKWSDILRSSRRILGDKGMAAMNQFIRQSVAANKPWDKFAREIVAARGSSNQTGAANFFRIAITPQEQAETVSQVFLGVRIQCARCHNHPYEKWKQQQYYQMAAFFARVKTKPGDNNDGTVIFASTHGDVTNPRTNKLASPTALDAEPLSADYTGDRREALAEWLTAPQNPFFARILVNRVWKHLMGVGLVEPVDDIRATNPPSNEPLFDALAADFVKQGYNVKALIREIMLSNAYQRSPVPLGNNAPDTKYYSHYAFKRLGAETLLDALASATGTQDKFDGYPIGTRAAQLPDPTVNSYFLDLFGRPARNSACECERSDLPNMGQVLHLMNDAGLNGRIAAKDARIAKLLAAKTDDAKLLEELYLGAYARYPSENEQRIALDRLKKAKDKQAAAEDILWAIINSNEFLFNH